MQPLTKPITASRPLRIALVSTSAVATPPKAYGGTELVIAELAKELRKLGHHTTVFATGDSTCEGEVRSLYAKPVWPPSPIAELRHAAFAWREIAQAGNYDVVHVNSVDAVPFARFADLPTVATVHHDRVNELLGLYADHPEVGYVAISRRQADLSPEIPFCTVVHHGLDIDRYPEGSGDGGYCAFLGRLAAEKAPHIAIDVAARAGVPIHLGGGVHPTDETYFGNEVAPRLRNMGEPTGVHARHLGELGHERKVELLSGARCLVFPICWEEPFGLVMIEAMLVGTPVVAFARGSAAEVIEQGVTGYLVHSEEEMVQRIRDLEHLDRKRCRERARERFSSARMAREYAQVYQDWIAFGKPAATAISRNPRHGAKDGSTGVYDTLYSGGTHARAHVGG